MEATGVYWKPVWAFLEDDFDCLLVDARHVKDVAEAPARPRPRARAVKHSIICAIWQMLSTGELYRELGGDYSANATLNDKPPGSSLNSRTLATK